MQKLPVGTKHEESKPGSLGPGKEVYSEVRNPLFLGLENAGRFPFNFCLRLEFDTERHASPSNGKVLSQGKVAVHDKRRP